MVHTSLPRLLVSFTIVVTLTYIPSSTQKFTKIGPTQPFMKKMMFLKDLIWGHLKIVVS
jgi:hypothetical protein